MTIFAVTYRYSDDVATRDALRTEHRDYLRGLADQGLLLVSGPFGPDEARRRAAAVPRRRQGPRRRTRREGPLHPQRRDRRDRPPRSGNRCIGPLLPGSHRRPAGGRRLADIGHQPAVQHRAAHTSAGSDPA